MEENIDKEIYNKSYLTLRNEKENAISKYNDCVEELELKKTHLKKNNNIGVQLRGIKDDKRLLKRTITNVISKIYVYPIFTHNLESFSGKEFKTNKQDKFVYIEVFTYLNDKIPLSFIISQRTEYIIYSQLHEFDKTLYSLEIGKREENAIGEEEEPEFIYKNLFHLKSMDRQ